MIIEGPDFKLEYVDESVMLFDLELAKVINKGKEKERIEFKNIGYGLTLDNAIKKIIMHRISNKHDVTDLKTFQKEFKEEREKIQSLLN